MASFRKFKTNKPCNFQFVLIVFLLFLLYFIYIYEFMIRLNPSFNIVTIPISVVLFILLAWSLFMAYIVQPGNVPKYFALYNQDMNMQRKYCLQCHNFKPQRTHHCSTCGKCILNMDHHCPIINNCVGFYNRKHFLLLLFYLILILLFALVQQTYLVIIELINVIQNKQQTDIHSAIRLLTVIGQGTFMFMMIFFFKMHLELVLKNCTTLQQLIKKKKIQIGQKIDQNNIYDLGQYKNFTQVFGENAFQWFIPINTQLPCDGMTWPKNRRQIDTQQISQVEKNNNKQKISFKTFY